MKRNNTMGLMRHFSDNRCSNSCSTNNRGYTAPEIRLGEPDPRKFTVLDFSSMNGITIAMLYFKGCVNFGGKKLLIFYDADFASIQKSGVCDPHFLESGVSPIARFEPTARGRSMALIFAKAWSEAKV